MSHEVMSAMLVFVFGSLGYIARQQRYYIRRIIVLERDLEECRQRIIRAFPRDTD